MAADLTSIKPNFIENTINELSKTLIGLSKNILDVVSYKEKDTENPAALNENASKKSDIMKNPYNGFFVLNNTLKDFASNASILFSSLKDTIKLSIKDAKIPNNLLLEDNSKKEISKKNKDKNSINVPFSIPKNFTKITDSLKSSIPEFSKSVSILPKNFAKITNSLKSSISKFSKQILSIPKNIISNIFNNVKNIISNSFKNIIGKFNEAFSFINNKIFDKIKNLNFFSKKKKNNIKDKAQNNISGSGILILASNIENSAQYIKSYKSLIKTINKIKAPSLKEFQKVQDSLDNFIKNIEKGINSKKSSILDFNKNIEILNDSLITLNIVSKSLKKVIKSYSKIDSFEAVGIVFTDFNSNVLLKISKINNKNIVASSKKINLIQTITISLIELLSTFRKIYILSSIAKNIKFNNVEAMLENFNANVIQGINKNINTKQVKKSNETISIILGISKSLFTIETSLIKTAILALPAALSITVLNIFISSLNKFVKKLNEINEININFETIKNISIIFNSIKNIELSAILCGILAPVAVISIITTKIAFSSIVSFINYIGLLKIDDTIYNNILGIGLSLMLVSSVLLMSTLIGPLSIAAIISIQVAYIAMDSFASFILFLDKNVLNRLDNSFIRSVGTAILATIELMIFSTILTISLGFLALSALLIPPAIITMVAFTGFLLIFTFIGNIAMKAIAGMATLLLASVILGVIAAVLMITFTLLAKTGVFILSKIPQILVSLLAFAGLVVLMAAMGIGAMYAMVPILALTIVSVAIMTAMIAINIALNFMEKITEDKVSKAQSNLIAINTLFNYIAETFKLPILGRTLGILIVLNLVAINLLVTSVALVASIKILSLLKPDDFKGLVGNGNKLDNTSVFGNIGLMFNTLALLLPSALKALAVSIVLILVSISMLLWVVPLVASIQIIKNLLAVKTIQLAEESIIELKTFMSLLIPLGLIALGALIPVLALTITSIALLISSLSLLGAIKAFLKIKPGDVGHAALTTLKLTGFIGELGVLGLATIVALPGIKILGKIGKEAKKIKNIVNLVLDLSKFDKNTIERAQNSIGAIKNIFTSLKEAGKASKDAKKSIKNLNQAKEYLVNLSPIFETLKNLPVNEETAKNAENIYTILNSISGINLNSLKNFINIDSATFQTNTSNIVKGLNEFSSLNINNENIDNLKNAVNSISEIDAKGFSKTMNNLFKPFKKVDPSVKSINKLTKSIRGLNTELQALNKNNNSLKAMNSLDISNNSTVKNKKEIADAKVSSFNNSTYSEFDYNTKLDEIKKLIENFMNAYTEKNAIAKNKFTI